MGIIAIVTAFIAGGIVGVSFISWLHVKSERYEVNNIEEILKMFPEDSVDFRRITTALSGLSDRAQATFIFLYIQAIAKNKRMIATANRYLAAVERPISSKEKEPALSRPAKGGLSKGLTGRG